MEFDFIAILGGAFGMLFNLPLIIFGIVIGRYARELWQVFAASVPAGIIDRLIQSAFSRHEPSPILSDFLLSAILAALLWSLVAFGLSSGRRRQRVSEDN